MYIYIYIEKKKKKKKKEHLGCFLDFVNVVVCVSCVLYFTIYVYSMSPWDDTDMRMV